MATSGDGFLFATGIECSYPTIAAANGRTVRVDELERTFHYRHWREDLGLVKDLGLRYLRYGPPYYRIHTAPDTAQAKRRDEEFTETWGTPYPAIKRPWDSAGEEFTPVLDYDVEIRRVLCSTNAIWVLYLPAWAGRCFPDQSWKRPALTLNAIDAERPSWTRSVGLAA